MQIIEISPFQAFRRSVVTVMQVVPKELRYVAILTLVGGAGPAIAIWLNKLIIDEGDKENKQCPIPHAPCPMSNFYSGNLYCPTIRLANSGTCASNFSG
ncbi:hypothetical protein [Nostoc commune]|nr:hypothetical protein [Nostoc commune]